MVDVEKLNELSNWYDANPNYPFALDELTPDVMECLGTDEDDIVAFIESATHEQLEFLSMFTEEILVAFPSEAMDKAIDIVLTVFQK